MGGARRVCSRGGHGALAEHDRRPEHGEGLEREREVGVMVGDSRFDAIVAGHHADIYRYLLRMTGGAPAADNLSRETFLRAYRSLPSDANSRAGLVQNRDEPQPKAPPR